MDEPFHLVYREIMAAFPEAASSADVFGSFEAEDEGQDRGARGERERIA